MHVEHADGKVARVDGIQAVVSKAPAEAVKGLEAQLQEQRLKDEFEAQIRLVPDTSVKAGDSWKRWPNGYAPRSTNSAACGGEGQGQSVNADRPEELTPPVQRTGRYSAANSPRVR